MVQELVFFGVVNGVGYSVLFSFRGASHEAVYTTQR